MQQNKCFTGRSLPRFFVLLATFILIAVSSLTAADVTARIRGQVTDPSGAVISNATITATNAQTGVSYHTKTQANGSYQFLDLPVGTYNISAEASGFQKFAATGITLNIDQEYVENVKLTVGSASETVEVQANAVQVDTTNIQLSNIVDSQQVVDLPLIGRNFTQLETIFPGVQASSDRFGTYSANGSQTQQTSFLINGTDINDAPLNTAVVIPSPDAVQQFNLVTSSLNPEYSRNSGAIVSVNIKNGTNQFHGSGFEFYRDTFLNTRNFFQTKAPIYHQHIFGGTVGGPVIKDKAFFFLSYQGIRARQPQTQGQQTVLSPAQRSGDFSSSTLSTNPIPATISVPGCTAGMTWRQCGAALGNKFPTSAFNPVSTNLLQFVPLPNLTGNNFIWNPITNLVQDQGIMRYDFTPTTANQFYFVGIFQHSPSQDQEPFTGATVPGFGEQATRETHQFTASWTHTLNATTLNEIRAGYTRFNFNAVVPLKVVDPASLGFNIKTQAPQFQSVPTVALTGYFTLGFSTNGPQPRIDQNYQVTDNFSKIVGNHSLKFGWDGRRFNVDNPFYGRLNGSYSFSTSGNPNTSGDAALDFLLGVPASYSQGSGAVIHALAYESYAYAQDQWKARQNLTLTFGVGWQVDTPWQNKQYFAKGVTCFLPGQQSSVFPTAPVGLNYPGDRHCTDTQGGKTTWKHVGPRVGFAFAPELGRFSGGDSRKLSIRGGYGIYFNRTEEEGSLQNLGDPPYGINSGGIGDLGGYPQFANPFADINTGQTIANKFPATPNFPPGTNVNWSIYEPFVLSQYGPNYTMPYSQNFNLTIERELPSNIVATLSYVGALGRHEQITYEGNPITQAGHDACLKSASCIRNRTLQSLVFPSHTLYGNGDIFSSVGLIGSYGTSNYNSLQLSARKGLTHGLLFQASYTWSHSLDNGSSFENSGFGGANRGYNLFVPSLNYGDSQFDVRHRFVFAPIYQVPNWGKLPGMHWLPGIIGKGWEITGITTLATGFPYDIRTTGSNSLYCSSGLQYYACPEVPVQTGAVQFLDPRRKQVPAGAPNGASANFYWFNPYAAFAPEPIGSFGNVHRNPFHGPGINNTDAAIYKNIYFWPGNESRYIQLRLESYNAFNHTQFSLPTGSVTFNSSNVVNNTFGRITSAAAGRQTQIAAKIYF